MLGATLVEVLVVTPFVAPLGWLGAYLVLIGALMFCSWSPWARADTAGRHA